MAVEPIQYSVPPTLDLTIVIVSFNTRAILLDCLRSVYAGTLAASFEVLVVDNASSDGSAEAVRRDFPQARVIANAVNRGFSAGCNAGIREAKGRYVALLNSDTVLIEDSFAKLVSHLDAHPEIGICSPQIMDHAGKICSMRLWQDTPWDAFMRILGKYDVAGEYSRMGKLEPKAVEALGGSCLIIRRELFARTGLMDEGFFLYNEEDDLCRRARAAGWMVAYYPEATVKHLHGKSTHQPEIREKVIVETYRSYVYFYSKYYPRLWNWFLRAAYCATFAAGIVKSFWQVVVKRQPSTPDNSLALKLKLLFMKVP